MPEAIANTILIMYDLYPDPLWEVSFLLRDKKLTVLESEFTAQQMFA